ncbi:unnamed protein product [Euphydryas editha]|uniref:SH2 domain-containing protein n=1 Tax=Euphydryas editha TaxID=104508 RepID=A0AAU9UZE5_EUPED|nr:unnamed protein product [Euphydryas editha]
MLLGSPYSIKCKNIDIYKWYHGIMSAKEAEHLMMERGRNGSFLVRESQTHPGEYVLTVRVRGRVSHVMIRKQLFKVNVFSIPPLYFNDMYNIYMKLEFYNNIKNLNSTLSWRSQVAEASRKIPGVPRLCHG